MRRINFLLDLIEHNKRRYSIIIIIFYTIGINSININIIKNQKNFDH